ncbi:FadR/GntR family transcriptional regulator [Georgenia yuyongxinii]|uniref:FadR/GntR family transcriptional regulator n=1 Tax=Georgenia yuyongxinii TaxID=2589797 RepID=UPI001CB6DD71|nr:FCD domain-containing protein [Georgenia yuyongxinii]
MTAPQDREMTEGWQVIGRSGLIARIRGEILRVMTERHLQPGERLPAERDLAAALEVSRPSVREAVRTLEAEGRLVVKHGQGVFVAEPATQQKLRGSLQDWEEDLSQLFAMREVIEVPAARWASQRKDPGELARIRAAYATLEGALDSDDVQNDKVQRLDALFHTRIVQAAGNSLLEQTQAVIYDLLLEGMRTTLEVEGRAAASRKEHLRILAAIESGDAEGAAEAAREHVLRARAAAERHLNAMSRQAADRTPQMTDPKS